MSANFRVLLARTLLGPEFSVVSRERLKELVTNNNKLRQVRGILNIVVFDSAARERGPKWAIAKIDEIVP